MLVDAAHFKPVDVIQRQEGRVTWAYHLNFAKHLADDNFKVLVMDVLTLGTVHLLDLGQQVHLAGIAPVDSKDCMRIE